jgi:hypothetical protein
MTHDLITLMANVALTLSFIVALVFGIVQVRVAGRERRERLTVDTLRNFRSREFCELMLYVGSHAMPSTRAEMVALPTAEQVGYVQFAQEMESLGILVAEGLVDIELVDKTLGSLVVTTWEQYEPMIIDSRVVMPDPFLAEYFQWLARQIDERMRATPRTPFHESAPSLRAPRRSAAS